MNIELLSICKKFASKHALAFTKDAANNVLIKRPGSGKGKHAPPVIIQGHIDMVTEKNASKTHDFFADPIELTLKGEWLHANGTTLGADNGIGVSAALALLEEPSSANLPPLECLFTVDEETGLTGAKGLQPDVLGITSTTLLNLDTEEWGTVYIGCAGGGDSAITFPVTTATPVPQSTTLLLTLDGLLGGHSGAVIHTYRGNAVQLMAQVLRHMPVAYQLLQIKGGDKRNAIAREATALILVPPSSCMETIVSYIRDRAAYIAQVYPNETALNLTSTAVESPSQLYPLDDVCKNKLIGLLISLPHGPQKMCHLICDPEGHPLCETSNNVASVTPSTQETHPCYTITCMTRSLQNQSLADVRATIHDVAIAYGATVTQPPAYPSWAPNVNSRILELTKSVVNEITGETVKVAAVHAGLECGLLRAMLPNLDCVSFGPTIRGAHSPDECIHLPTVEPFYKTVRLVLEKLSE